MGGLMRPEFLLLLVAGMLLFGAKRLPEMGSAIGKTIKEFQRSIKEEPQVTPPPAQPSVATPAQPQVTTTTPSASLNAPATTTATPVETPAQ